MVLSYCSYISAFGISRLNPGDTTPDDRTFSYNPHQITRYSGGEMNSCSYCHVSDVGKLNNNIYLSWDNNSVIREFNEFSDNATKDDGIIFSSQTKMCVSCHDGNIANDNFTIKSSGFKVSSKNRSYTNESNHPTSIIYNSQVAQKNKYLKDPSIAPSGLGGTIEEDLLDDGKVSCLSCHNFHFMDERQTIQNGLTLKITMVRSELCFTCHDM